MATRILSISSSFFQICSGPCGKPIKHLAGFSCLPAVLVWLSVCPAFCQTEELVALESRPGIRQAFILIQPVAVKAAVILFAGGHGALKLETKSGRPRMRWGANNFLVRTRDLFARQKLMVAVIDAPSDRQELTAAWRISSEHAADIQAVITALNQKTDRPLWLVGTSMGTFSAANAAIRLPESVHGLILTSSVTRSRKTWSIQATHPNGIVDMGLDHITAPTLIVFHRDDQCPLTPPRDAEQIKNRLTHARRAQIRYVSGGLPPESGACQAMSAHGFLGIENEVVKTIADFIITPQWPF